MDQKFCLWEKEATVRRMTAVLVFFLNQRFVELCCTSICVFMMLRVDLRGEHIDKDLTCLSLLCAKEKLKRHVLIHWICAGIITASRACTDARLDVRLAVLLIPICKCTNLNCVFPRGKQLGEELQVDYWFQINNPQANKTDLKLMREKKSNLFTENLISKCYRT